MLKKFKDDLVTLSQHIFSDVSSRMGQLRFWIGMKILPEDVSNFVFLILSKMATDIQKMESQKIEKISSVKIDFEFRD